jgi:tetratricopeptide (TPR) repeat protein
METETRIDNLIERWEELQRRGTPLTIEDLCSDCPELAAEVRRRIALLHAIGSALDTASTERRPPAGGPGPAAAATRRPPEVARATAVYRTEGPHRHGGLGVVFTAHQQELGRTVALKRIRPDKLHETARRRFLREAALTARLQHPGIVPIYGLGEDDDGPFYAMPLIRGRTLQEAIAAFHADEALRRDAGRRELRLRELLQHFVAACNAVAYAHDQGVVHRDLKPSNLMLGPYGETLVLDWGLAKAVGADEATTEAADEALSPAASPEELTATGAVLGTPRYMSPEQARGEPAGPAGDIFGLGLVLYAILTGKSAYEESSFGDADPLEAVRAAAIVPPRRRDPGLPQALEAICLKALAARPEGRYATARALAEDVTRWLGDEPVTAWREPVTVRVRRWARRHRTAVMAAVVALAAGAVGLGAVAAVQARANVRLKRALAESEESRKQVEAARTFLVQAFRSPDPSQDGRQVKVVDLLDRAGKRLDQESAGSPATQGALLDALGQTYRGLGLYDQAISLHTRARAVREAALGPDHPDTLGSRSNLALAYRDAGRTAEAIALDELTLKLREAALGPDHPDTLGSRNNLAAAYAEAGRMAEAVPLFEATLKWREARLGPDHPRTLQSRNNLANAYFDTGRWSEATALCEGTFKLREAKLGPDHPETLQSRNNLAGGYFYIGRWSEAIALYEGTFKLREAKLGPDHPETLYSRIGLAAAYHRDGRTAEAIPLFESTLKRMEIKLGPDHPDTLECRRLLASAYDSLGRREAGGLYGDVLARRRKSVPPDSPLLADDLAALARNLMDQSRWSEAEPLSREALAIREKATPDDWRRCHAMSLLGGALLGQGRPADAESLVVRGYEGMKAREGMIPVPHRDRLREAAERVVHLYETWGRPEEATAWKAKVGMPDLPADVFAHP